MRIILKPVVAQNVTVKKNWPWVRSPLEETKYLLKNVYIRSFALVSRQIRR